MQGFEKLLKGARTKRFDKNQVLVHQDDKPSNIYIVKSGVISCYDISLDGSQQLIWLLSKGDMFPLSLLLNIDERVRFFYSAFVDVEVYVISKTKLSAYMKLHPEVLYEVCTDITRKFNDLHYRVNATGKPKAREKILHTLAFVADRFRLHRRSEKHVEVSVPLTHQDIANLVGLTRETTAATLKDLKDEGYVDYDRQRFLIYRQKIEDVLW